MGPRRVVVTGVGVLCGAGNTREEFWDALCAGRTGIGPIESVDTAGIGFSQGAEVRGFDPAAHFTSRAQLGLDRFSQYALVAAREAVADADAAWGQAAKDRTAVVTGTGSGGLPTQETNYERMFRHGKTRVNPTLIPNVMCNAGASQISMEFGLRGPGMTLSTACSSSTHAIGTAFWLVRNGAADRAVAGGSEAVFTWGILKAWDSIRVVSPDLCRPFSKSKPGMVLGEGAAMLVLETLESAQARGATIYAEIAGFGMSSDAEHLTHPSSDGPIRAMRAAIEDAGARPDEIDYVNAHGTGTAANDDNELAAICSVLGDQAQRVAVSSTKAIHGHAIGAAGALEAAATALAVRHGVLPPTANLNEPDPSCPVDVVPNVSRPAVIRAALSNSFAFGGLNAVLMFRRVDGVGPSTNGDREAKHA